MAKIETIQTLTVKRNAPSGGPIYADTWNDTIEEILHDFSELSDQWNNNLTPLTDTLPDGTLDASVNAFSDGLSGKTIFTSSDATSTSEVLYWNSGSARPKTLFEQFADIYNTIDNVKDTLEGQIAIQIPAAIQVGIADNNNLFTSTNVEDALAEVKTAVDTLSLTGNVTKVGTPVNNQLGVWTGDGTIEGDSNLLWDGSNLGVTGNVGIGTDLPDTLLHLESAANPTIKLNKTATSTSCFELVHADATQTILRHNTNNGQSLIDINPIPEDGTSTGYVRIGRETTTTGGVGLLIHEGNGSATIQHALTNVTSYLCSDGSPLGIGTVSPDASAALDLSSTTKGFLPPRMNTTQRDAITAPVAGLTIFNTTTTKLETWDGSTWQAHW